jgi:hypothetical protein
MPFAIEMVLDGESADTVRGIWRDLAETGVAPEMHESGARPHVTLGVCDGLNVEACSTFLEEFAAAISALTVRFSSIGIFGIDPAVVFLAPAVTPELLDIHLRFHQRFSDVADSPWAYYLPNRWVPHCTLTTDLPLASVPRVVGVCRTLRLPLDGRLEGVGIVEFRPIRHHGDFQFAVG